MFHVVVLLDCCATIASAGPTTSTNIAEIHAILAKLFIPWGPLTEYHATTPGKAIEDAVVYAYWYWEALDVYKGYPGSLVESEFWDAERFQQRVQKFGWERLLPNEQRLAMARQLVKLLELVEPPWGGELNTLETKWSTMENRPAYLPPPYLTTTQLKSNLEAKIKALEIHAILEKLFVPSKASRVLPSASSPKEVIEDAIRYANRYMVALSDNIDVWILECPAHSIVQPGHGRPHVFWGPTSFEQRVKNFGWEDLKPAAKQYHAMARVLVRLLEDVDSVWGGRGGELEKVGQSLLTGFYYPTFAQIQRNLKAKIEALCYQYNFANVTPKRWPFDFSPKAGDGEKPTLVDGETNASVSAQQEGVSRKKLRFTGPKN